MEVWVLCRFYRGLYPIIIIYFIKINNNYVYTGNIMMKVKNIMNLFKMNNKNIWISLLLVLFIFVVLSFISFPFYEGAVDMKGAKAQAEKEKETTKQSSAQTKEKKQKEADETKAKATADKATSNKATKRKVDNTISRGKEKIKKTQEDIDAKKKKLDKAKQKTT